MPNSIANLFNIISTKIESYQGSDGDSIIATGGGSAGKGETAEVYSSPGIISRPGKNTKGLRLRFGKIDIIIAVYNYGLTPPDNPGETRIYSTDADGVEQATAKFLDDGTIELNGDTDYAVAFNDLKSGFDDLKSDFNSLVSSYNAFLLHVHGAAGTPPVPPATPAASSTASIDGAKIDEIKVP